MPRHRSEEGLDPHLGEPRPGRSWVRPVAIGLLAAPFLSDALALCHAEWRGLFGPMIEVRTPALDLVGGVARAVAVELSSLSRRPFRRLPWRPQWILGVMSLAIGAGMLIIRPGRPR